MSKIIQPFGKLKKEIIIKADEKGMIIVDAYSFESIVQKGFRPSVVKVPIDVREMVLALIKVVQDYSTVLFATMGEGIIKHGQQQEDKNDNHTGQPG